MWSSHQLDASGRSFVSAPVPLAKVAHAVSRPAEARAKNRVGGAAGDLSGIII
jgi:hypothetical protein